MGTSTLLLDRSRWDLVLDAAGNIAVASSPYALAQDAASAIKTFQGEVYWDTTIGVPYLSEVLGQRPSVPLLKSLLASAAITVPGVAVATVFFSSVTDRVVSGQVQVMPSAPGEQGSAASFSFFNPQGEG